MQNTAWIKSIEKCADPRRAQRFYDQLKETSAAHLIKEASPEQATAWCALFSGSEASSELLVAHPEWLEPLRLEFLDNARRAEGMRRDLHSHLQSSEYTAAFREIRLFKQREMLRIAARDLARLGPMAQIIQEISDVADVCLEAVYELCFRQRSERAGLPYHQEADGRWTRTQFCVLALGQLGGQELNYSSAVELLFVYSDEGSVFKIAPRKNEISGRGRSNSQFFKQLAEDFIAELARATPEGALFQAELKWRSTGKSASAARSLESYENHLAQYGQTTHRMMLIKARPVAGDVSLGAEFVNTIQPFRYARANLDRVPHELALLKAGAEEEIANSNESDRDVRLGRGGIREIEFVAQALQALSGGRLPFLQNPQTLPTLQKLGQYHLLKPLDVTTLTEAYVFLRDVEHRLQLDRQAQTHTIPTERRARERLAALMGFTRLLHFETALASHRRGVRAIYDSILQAEQAAVKSKLPRDFDAGEKEWRALLAEHSFTDPEASFRGIRQFVTGPGFGHISASASESAFQLLERFLNLCPTKNSARPPDTFLADPDHVLARLDRFVANYGARALLYETWAGNPSLFDLLLWLFDRSESLSKVAIREPDLIDELEQSGQLRRLKGAETILTDLRQGLKDADQLSWIRRFHRAERMRITLRDILNLSDPEQTQIELTALADASLQYALETTLADTKLTAPPFAVIGLGKLGGQELTYGSGLDLLLVASDGDKNPSSQEQALKIIALLRERTADGTAFATNPPQPTVNTLAAHEEFFRANPGEIQALTRARFIAGDAETGAAFTKMAARLCNFSNRDNWMEEMHRQRSRIEKTSVQQNIEKGAGGLLDAEFAAQSHCLKNGWHHPNTLRALARAIAQKAAPTHALESMTQSYRDLMRIDRVLRRWNFEADSVLPEDPAELNRVAAHCGFRSAAAFTTSIHETRNVMRKAYQELFTLP